MGIDLQPKHLSSDVPRLGLSTSGLLPWTNVIPINKVDRHFGSQYHGHVN